MELNEPTTNHDHASPSLKFVLLLFVLILVASLGYLVYAYNSEPDTTDYSAPKVKTADTATTDETADWKTYEYKNSGSSFGYTVKYPTDWEISADDLNSAAAIWEYGLRPSTLKNDYLMGVSHYDGNLEETAESVKYIFESNSTFMGQEEVQVGKETGVRLDFQNNSSTSVKPSVYLFEKCSEQNSCTTFGISGSGSADTAENEEIIKKIISTFKIISQ